MFDGRCDPRPDSDVLWDFSGVFCQGKDHGVSALIQNLYSLPSLTPCKVGVRGLFSITSIRITRIPLPILLDNTDTSTFGFGHWFKQKWLKIQTIGRLPWLKDEFKRLTIGIKNLIPNCQNVGVSNTIFPASQEGMAMAFAPGRPGSVHCSAVEVRWAESAHRCCKLSRFSGPHGGGFGRCVCVFFFFFYWRPNKRNITNSIQ